MKLPLATFTFLCSLSLLSPGLARAEEKGEAAAYDQAFSPHTRRIAKGAGSLALAVLPGFLAAIGDHAVEETADSLRLERQSQARSLATMLPQHRTHIAKELELELLKDKPSLSLTALDKVRMKSLREEIAAYPGRAVVAHRRAWLIRQTEDLETGRSFLADRKSEVRRAKALKWGSILGAVSLAAHGTYQIGRALWENEPGYSPAVNLSRKESKQPAASAAPRPEPSADTSFSAE